MPQAMHFRNSILHIEPSAKWVRCVLAGVVIADSKQTVLLRSVGERRVTPVYYFPRRDVRTDLLQPSGQVKNDSHLGDAVYYHISVGAVKAEHAAWSIPESFASAEGMLREDAPDLSGYIAFVWNKLDSWFEEDEEVYQHARDPYVRVDCLPSRRHVRILIQGKAVADTQRPILLFETGLITRYYIPKADVRIELLRDSPTVTRCPYKGLASHYSLDVGGKSYEDIAWYYPQTTPQAMRIAGYICFYDERMGLEVEVDGLVNPTPASRFKE